MLLPFSAGPAPQVTGKKSVYKNNDMPAAAT
jgi:hypothetical protein